MKKILMVFLIVFAAPVAAHAQDKGMQIALAEESVDITTGFNGTRVTLFGTIKQPGADLVITLKGPEQKVFVRKKSRALMGAWMNTDKVEFRRVPSYYDFASTMGERELDQYPVLMKEGQIGVENLDMYTEEEGESTEKEDIYRDALIRGKQSRGFYPIKPGEIEYIDRNFFKVSFDIPPSVPTGLYTIEAILTDDGQITGRETKSLQVGQVGFNAKVYLFAQDYSFFYGILCVFIAVISGWSAFTFLRRD